MTDLSELNPKKSDANENGPNENRRQWTLLSAFSIVSKKKNPLPVSFDNFSQVVKASTRWYVAFIIYAEEWAAVIDTH